MSRVIALENRNERNREVVGAENGKYPFENVRVVNISSTKQIKYLNTCACWIWTQIYGGTLNGSL